MEMLTDDDPKKLRAALEQLEAEQARRIQIKIEAGALINVPLEVVVGDEAEAADEIERAKAQALLDLQAKGDTRPALFDVTLIITGVPSGPEKYGHYESSSDPPSLKTARYPADECPALRKQRSGTRSGKRLSRPRPARGLRERRHTAAVL